MDKFVSFEFFQLFDTFSLLSLGIIFVLIFLVIFHFKSRIQSLEAKNDHVYVYCNKIAYELEEFKNISSLQNTIKDTFLQDSLHNSFQETFMHDKLFKKLNVFECVLNDEVESVSITDDIDDRIQIEETQLIQETQKGIHFEVPSSKPQIDISEEITENDEMVEPKIESHLVESHLVESHLVESHLKPKIESHLEQKEEEFHLEDLSVITVDKNEYSNMTVQMLRTMAVAKGIVVDVSKMKKKEIVKLLDGLETSRDRIDGPSELK